MSLGSFVIIPEFLVYYCPRMMIGDVSIEGQTFAEVTEEPGKDRRIQNKLDNNFRLQASPLSPPSLTASWVSSQSPPFHGSYE